MSDCWPGPYTVQLSTIRMHTRLYSVDSNPHALAVLLSTIYLATNYLSNYDTQSHRVKPRCGYLSEVPTYRGTLYHQSATTRVVVENVQYIMKYITRTTTNYLLKTKQQLVDGDQREHSTNDTRSSTSFTQLRNEYTTNSTTELLESR
jgi:hypothetical protein